MMTMKRKLSRRQFLQSSVTGLGAFSVESTLFASSRSPNQTKPNLVFVLTDQWRAQATGYAGDPNAVTPNLNALTKESVNFTNAVSGCPVCTPYRASLMTGQYWLTHGLFLNDLCLGDKAVSIAQVYGKAGYDTAYIGKWHLDGHGRSAYIPPERRQGFDYWKVLECTHNYNKSAYYAGNDATKRYWDGYDAIAQTEDAQKYIKTHAESDKPFALFVSLGPPHNPYLTAPQRYRDMFPSDQIKLRPNVKGSVAKIRQELAGYYAHIAALDDCLGRLLRTLHGTGIAENTLLVFTSDHGDMLGSQGQQRKQRPWDESIKVPFLLRYPQLLGTSAKTIDMPINTPDIMPTLLGLCGIRIPGSVEGSDFSGVIKNGERHHNEAALIACFSPFAEYKLNRGREFRGIRTRRHTYVRDLQGPWLLYDNKADPYQTSNLVNEDDYAAVQKQLDSILTRKLKQTNDAFLPGQAYIRKWDYKVNKSGSVPYKG